MADAPLTPLSEKEAPKTFAERGASVPFTSPSLMWARVRQRDHIKELLVPGLANTRGIYVFEWPGIQSRFTLTLHDRLLHRAIGPEKNPTPATIARIANKIALGGSAGPDVQAAAQKRQKDTQNLVVMARLTLTMRAIERMSGDGSTTTVEELGTDAGQRRAKQLLAKIAGGLNLNAEAFYARIETLSSMLGEVGMPGMPVKAPTRQLIQRMLSLARVLSDWASDGRGDSRVEAQLIARVAEETVRLVENPIHAIDQNTLAIENVLRAWDSGQRIMATAVDRAAWLLDGWDRLCNMWLDVADKSSSEQSTSLALMSYLLPMIPPNEMPPEDATRWGELAKVLYTQARSSETPSTGGIDLEMMLRLEGHRTRELS
jgi:hypothetical protein